MKGLVWLCVSGFLAGLLPRISGLQERLPASKVLDYSTGAALPLGSCDLQRDCFTDMIVWHVLKSGLQVAERDGAAELACRPHLPCPLLARSRVREGQWESYVRRLCRLSSADLSSMHVRPCESGTYSEELRDTKGRSLNADRCYHQAAGPQFPQLQGRRTSARSVPLVPSNHQDSLRAWPSASAIHWLKLSRCVHGALPCRMHAGCLNGTSCQHVNRFMRDRPRGQTCSRRTRRTPARALLVSQFGRDTVGHHVSRPLPTFRTALS